MSDKDFDLWLEREQKIEEAVKAAKEKYKGTLSNEEIQNIVTEYLGKLSDDDILDLNKVGGSAFFTTPYSENSRYQSDVLDRIVRKTNPKFYASTALKKASDERLQQILEEKRKNQLEELNKKLATPNSDTLEKRLQRAKDMGFDTSQTYYHGTPSITDFNEFDKPKDAGIYFSSDPKYVDKWAIDESQLKNPNVKPRTLPVFLRAKNTFDYNNPDHLEKLMRSVIKNDPWTFEQALLEKIPNSEQRSNFILSLMDNPTKYEEFIKNNPTLYLKAIDEAQRQINVKNNYRGIREIAPQIKEAGFDSYISYDDDDLNKITKNIAVFDPKNIRSKFAAFDPSKTDSSDISSLVETKSKPNILNKAFKLADLYGNISDITQGDVLNPAISAAESIAPKLGVVAGRTAPLLDLLRPTATQTQEQEDEELQKVKFKQIKKTLNNRGLDTE